MSIGERDCEVSDWSLTGMNVECGIDVTLSEQDNIFFSFGVTTSTGASASWDVLREAQSSASLSSSLRITSVSCESGIFGLGDPRECLFADSGAQTISIAVRHSVMR